MNRQTVFEAIRAARDEKRFSLDEVAAIDTLLDTLDVPRIGGDDWLPAALTLIKQFEGCRLSAYPDPGSGGEPITIGWGSVGGIKLGDRWTQAQADTRLATDVAKFAAGVDKLLTGPTKPYQKAALVSLAYNIGLGNLSSSTLLRMHNAGNYTGAAGQWGRWNRASGRVMAGLTRRREAEASVYEGKQ